MACFLIIRQFQLFSSERTGEIPTIPVFGKLNELWSMQINIPSEKFVETGSKVVNKIKKVNRVPKWFWYLLSVIALALVALVVWWNWPEPAKPVYPMIEAEKVKTQNVEIYGEYAGKIRAQQYVEVRARVEGYLEEMLFTEGTYVKKGDVLFVIDPKVYRAKVEKAKAQLNKNKALELKAKRDLDRIKPLYEQNAASRLDLDNATAAYESAKAEVVMGEADLTQAEIALGYTTVRSPISGYISERHVDMGTLVGPSGASLLATIVKSDTVRVDFSMTALDYLKSKERNVQLGHAMDDRDWNPYVTITLADNSQYPMKGLVDFADPQVDPNTGTFSVRAEMANPDQILLPGQLTKVKLLLDVHENAIIVPRKAVVIEKGGAYIFVVRKDNVVEKRFIELGPEVGNIVVVDRGLGADEYIVTEGYHKLTHGMIVNPVIKSEESPAAEDDSATSKSVESDEK